MKNTFIKYRDIIKEVVDDIYIIFGLLKCECGGKFGDPGGYYRITCDMCGTPYKFKK